MAASQQCRVVVRLRPTADVRCVEVDAAGQLIVGGGRGFAFDSVLAEEAGQEDVWAACGAPLVATALSGCTSALLVYGQSGSGKTHTMGTGADAQADRGLVARCAEALAGAGEAASLSLTLVEIYHERIRDLLSPAAAADNLAIHEGERGTYCGATDAAWRTAGDVERLLREGRAHRSVGATAMNATSSRSHLVLTLTALLPNGTVGKLILVDLAGSERAKRTGAAGGALDEACSINKSLSALGNVISARTKAPACSDEAVIPYRDSKLTRLLREALCGDAALTLILCASPAAVDANETLSTLRFGARAKEMVCTPTAAPVPLEVQLAEARRVLAARDGEVEALRLLLADARAGGAEKGGTGWVRDTGWLLATWCVAVATVLV